MVGWFYEVQPVCDAHKKKLGRGRTVDIFTDIKAKDEDWSIDAFLDELWYGGSIKPIVNVEPPVVVAPDHLAGLPEGDADVPVAPRTDKSIKCGNCGNHHASIQGVKDCYTGLADIPTVTPKVVQTKPFQKRVPVKKVQFGEKKTSVACGNCRKLGVENPYHSSAAEVKNCYLMNK